MPHPSQWNWFFDTWNARERDNKTGENRRGNTSEITSKLARKIPSATSLNTSKIIIRGRAYIVVEEVAFRAEVFAETCSAVRTVLLHLSTDEMGFFFSCGVWQVTPTVAEEHCPCFVRELTSCSLLQREQITCNVQRERERYRSSITIRHWQKKAHNDPDDL